MPGIGFCGDCLRAAKTHITLAVFSFFLCVSLHAESLNVAHAASGADLTLSHTTTGTTASSDSGWTFRLAPYGWLPALNGDVGIKGISSHVNVSIGDVLDHVDGALMLSFEAKHDRWSINNDFFWSQLSDSSPSPRGIFFTDAKLELNEIIWTPSVTYALVKAEHASLDVLAGMRLLSVDTDLTLNGATLPTGETVSSRKFSKDEAWVDPIIGLRGYYDIGSNVFFLGMGDIGGFNASSTLTWQAMLAAGYRLSPNASLGAGYRAMGYDHNRNSFEYEVNMYGPFLGAEFHF